MQRLTGQDASFLYTETPTVLMHTLKIQIFESAFDGTDYEIMRDRLEAALDVVPMLRQRVMFVPFNLHHPVMVDDPDFDLDSHIYRTALPAPGDDKELDQMISQIMCHRLDRQRPLWELWMITGLQDGKVAVVHKVHHCLADGAATVRYLGRVFEQQATYEPHSREAWRPKPLPPSRRLVWDALVDHFKYDIRRLPAFLSRLWRSARNLIAFNRDVGSPMIDTMMVHKPPRARFNHTLSARRNFARRQVPLQLVKEAGSALGGTVNDVVLAMAAGAIRNYLLHHRDLPSEPLCTSIPVSADEPGVSKPDTLNASCFCGAVEFEVSGSPEAMGYCHCESCRHWSAGPVNAFSLWKPESVVITKGADKIGTFAKTDNSHRKWCKECGGHLMTDHPGMGLVDVYTALIPDLDYQPGLHVFYAESVLSIKDGLPKMRDMPAEMGGSGETLPE